MLRLHLLGSPQILLSDQPLTALSTNKAQALLFYLAVSASVDRDSPIPHSRDAIATLLWGEMSDTKAKQNLRSVLPDLRRLLGDHLQIERQTIAFNPSSPYWLDVQVLRRDLATGRSTDLATRQAAVDLYRGEFLSGFYVRNAPAFEEWVLEQREQIHVLLVEASFSLVSEYMQQGDYAAALAANRKLLLLDPWSEPVHRQQMLLLAHLGERASALAQYESCQRILMEEFGVAPLPETTALFEQIRSGAIGEQEKPGWGELGKRAQADNRDQPDTEAKAPTGQQLGQQLGQPTQVAGHILPQRAKLYGREQELARLHQWIVRDSCHLVGIFGIGGQGKTALAANLVRDLAAGPQQAFQQVIWHSLLNAPPLAEIMQEWLYVLSGQTLTHPPASLDQQLRQLLGYLREQRSLLVLDNMESIMGGDARSGYYRPEYEEYGQLIRHVVAGGHRSCLLLTSRERPRELNYVEEETPSVRLLPLEGLPDEAGRQMIAARGVAGDAADLAALVQHYSGNPLALKLTAETLDSLFDGSVSAFLQTGTRIFDDIRDVLDQQFAQLAPLEHELLGWLAIVREPVSYAALRDLLAQPPAPRLTLEAMRSLQRRSLLESYDSGFGLQNVVMEYATEGLVDTISTELIEGIGAPGSTASEESADAEKFAGALSTSALNRHALNLAQSKEYVRASQTRLLLEPVAQRLVAKLGVRGTEQRLHELLAHMRAAPPSPGYAAANLLHLLLHLEVDPGSYDFSQLYLRQPSLRGVDLPGANFAGAKIMDSTFTEPFGLIYAVATSPDGQYLAAGSSEGDVYLWRTADQQLARVIRAHSQAVKSLSIAQRTMPKGKPELILASASTDGRVGLWSPAERERARWHQHLAHEQPKSLLFVGLAPDGGCAISVDNSGEVFVWGLPVNENAGLVRHFASTVTRFCLVAYSGDSERVAVGHPDGSVQLRRVATGELVLELTVETRLIAALALSADGQMLAVGSDEGNLYLWNTSDGHLHDTIETLTAPIDALAFSADGQMLASTHGLGDQAVRLWSIDTGFRLHLRQTLMGHKHIIWSAAFGPPPSASRVAQGTAGRQLLVTGSSDQTVRVWDAATGQSLYTLRGQPRALSAIAIQPFVNETETSEWLLAAVGYDHLVHLWEGRGAQTLASPRTLRGPNEPLYAVAISPDGRMVSGTGHDGLVYLWDRASGQLIQRLRGHTDSVECLAFHPDGTLLASGSADGEVRLWAIEQLESDQSGRGNGFPASQPLALFRANTECMEDIAFSPDGNLLATAGVDRALHVWDVTQRHNPKRTEVQKTIEAAEEHDIFAVAFSPEGTRIACGGSRLIHIWNLCDDSRPLVLQGHTASVFSVAFSPDGATLVSGSADCTVCLWEATSGTLRAVLHGHSEIVYKVTFSPDGCHALSCSADGTIRFWDVQTGKCVHTLEVEGPYAGMNITGVTGVTEAQKAALKALGAVEE